MQIKDVRPETFVKQLRCDRCGRLADVSEPEFQEFVSIDLRAGYASIFGDGNDVQLDLCQHCLKATLGTWLRVSDAEGRQRALEDRLQQFDPQRHGGEFPAVADDPQPVPEDLAPQDRRAWMMLEGRDHRLAPVRRVLQHSMRVFFAPLTGSIRGLRQEYQRIAWTERIRRRRQAEFVRRGREAIKRAESAGDWTPADVVVAGLSAKVDEARKRRTLGLLKGKLDVPPSFDDDLPSEVIQDFEGGVTRDAKSTVIARMQNNPAFALALIDEAIEMARNGEHEIAKQILRDLVGISPASPPSNQDGG